MKITNNEIYALMQGLQELKSLKVTMPIKDGFNLVKDIKILTPIVEAIDESREEIISKYANQSGAVPPESAAQANQELYELSLIENEVDLIKLPLIKVEKLELDLNLISKIAPIIEDEE